MVIALIVLLLYLGVVLLDSELVLVSKIVLLGLIGQELLLICFILSFLLELSQGISRMLDLCILHLIFLTILVPQFPQI